MIHAMDGFWLLSTIEINSVQPRPTNHPRTTHEFSFTPQATVGPWQGLSESRVRREP